MIHLVPMTQSELDSFLERDIPQFAQENVKAGYWSADEALERSRSDHEKLLPQGLATPDHHFFNIQEAQSGQKVGINWMKVNKEHAMPSGFIFNLEVDEPFRRRGFAAQAMLALEDKAEELGLATLFLHVFAHNQSAQALYHKLGYQVTSLNMAKRL